jgi:cephalosporin hydroxylase
MAPPQLLPIPTQVAIQASVLTLARNAHVWPNGMLKLAADLTRYEHLIRTTRPAVVVETGTRTGGSAIWFLKHGPRVVTVDIQAVPPIHPRVTFIHGNSTAPAVVDAVYRAVQAHRQQTAWYYGGMSTGVMVSLDSDHSASHVADEIDAYGPMVTPGCHLVVEDTIFGYADKAVWVQHGLGDMEGSPLDAVAAKLVDNPDWTRDVEVEAMRPTTHHPAGWWRRNG